MLVCVRGMHGVLVFLGPSSEVFTKEVESLPGRFRLQMKTGTALFEGTEADCKKVMDKLLVKICERQNVTVLEI